MQSSSGKRATKLGGGELKPASFARKGTKPIQVVVLPAHVEEVHARCVVKSEECAKWIVLFGTVV